MQEDLNAMRKDVTACTLKRLEEAISVNNRPTNLIFPFFLIRNYVLDRIATDRNHELQFSWTSPERSLGKRSGLLYDATPLRGRNTKRLPCTQLLENQDDLFDSKVAPKLLEITDLSDPCYGVAQWITDDGKDSNGIFL